MRVRSSNLRISSATCSPPFSISSEPACTSVVTALIAFIAVKTSLLPFSCSRIASVRRALMSFTCSARLKIVLNSSSTVRDEAERLSISPLKVLSVALIVFPCPADSSANFLISSATTANPLPASPACAASIAAFIARRFVWLAICWITLEASIRLPDSSAIFWVTLFEFTKISFPLPVAFARLPIALSVFSRVCVMEEIFATISSIEEEDCATLKACESILVSSCRMVRIISSIVAAVSVTLEACVNAFCLTLSTVPLICWMELAVSFILLASSLPITCMASAFWSTVLMDTAIFCIVSLKYSESFVISSLPISGSRTVRSPSPWAMFSNALTAVCNGCTILRAMR